MSDLISRADAIDAVAEEWLSEASAESPYVNDNDIDRYRELAEELFADIPSAEAEPKWNCTANFVAEQLERLKDMTDEERWDFFIKFFSPSAEAVHKPDYSYEADMVKRLRQAEAVQGERERGMTREKAVLILEEEAEFLYGGDAPYNKTAFDMAIEALQKETERQEMIIRASEKHLGLVRCKDCRYGEHIQIPIWENRDIDKAPSQFHDFIKCHKFHIKGFNETLYIGDDDFCSYGERREP